MNKLSTDAVEVFYSYAHEDEELLNSLKKHLSVLRQEGRIKDSHDRQIIAGADWAHEIDRHIDTAALILLLISPVTLPRFDRVPKAEIYSIKPGRGSSWQRFKKSTHVSSKRKRFDEHRPAASPLRRRARELGISDTPIHQWRKELTQHGKEAFPGSGHQPTRARGGKSSSETGTGKSPTGA